MGKFTLTIDTDNAAFAEMGALSEVARILRELSDDLGDDEAVGGNLYDYNGNKVGRWTNKGSK
jgi:hypothetical protein